MKVTILGSGTSTGVPVIGCECNVCTSKNDKDKRLRSSILVQKNGKNIIVDTGTDFRAQALKFNIKRVDAVLYTHAHADHIFGIDELRVFNLIQKESIPCYGSKEILERLKKTFFYIFEDKVSTSFKPSIIPNIISEKFPACGVEIIPVEVLHGDDPIFGFRFDDFAYITDCKTISKSSLEKLAGLKILILGTIRYRQHKTHMNLDEALEVTAKLKPEKTFLTHLSHEFSHEELLKTLPENVEPAYDGMVID